LDDQSLAWCFQAGYAFMWHPLTWMSHLLDYQLYGIRYPGGHHASSVLLHIFNSTLLFLVLNRMTKALWRSAMVAALFAWHPLHVESVAWISERKDVLSAFFWMLTLWAYVRYAEECKRQNAKGKRFYVLALVFFVLGLMSKPMLVTLPFVLLLLDWWPLQRFQFPSLNLNPNPTHEPSPHPDPLPSHRMGAEREQPAGLGGEEGTRPAAATGSGEQCAMLPSGKSNPDLNPQNNQGSTESSASAKATADKRPGNNWQLLIEKIPFFVLSILSCLITLGVASRTMLPLARLSLFPRLLTALVIYFRYVSKMIWPQGMVIAYPLDSPLSTQEVLTAGLFLIVVSVIAIRLWRKRPFWLTGWLLYLGVLVPVIGLVQVGTQPMADRYTYLSSIGIFLIVCWEGHDIASGWRHGRAILGTAAVAALAACCVMSGRQLEYWRNPSALHLHNIDVMPNSVVARADYAAFLRDDLQLEAARVECEKAILLKTNAAYPHQILGGVLFLEDKLEQAEAELRTALRLEPGRLDAHMVLGQVAIARDAPAEAVAHYNTVLAAEPTNAEAHCNLGRALVMQGKVEEAHAEYAAALSLAPQYPEAHHQLAVLLALEHNTAEAVQQYHTTLQLQPDRPDTLNNLAWILATDPRAETRNGKDAVRLASAACKLTLGRNPLMLGTLAACFAEYGDFEKAVTTAQQAHDLAVAQGKTDIAARNLQLLELYRARQPYHEK
jgi:Flp pilus assembly protein TadD